VETDPRTNPAIRLGRRVVAWFGESPVRSWALIFGLFLVGRVVLIAGGHVFTSSDAWTYAARPGQPDDGLLSFTGDAPRPWGLPLFYAAFGSDEARAVGQWAIGTLAWAYFAWEVSRNLRTRAASYATAAALLLLALLHDVASWDLAILSESLSLSLGVLVLGLLLRWLRTGSIVSIAGLTAVAIWWSFLRPDIRVFTAVLMGVLLLIAAGAAWRVWRARPVPGPRAADRTVGAAGRTVITAVVATLVLGLGMVWYSAITPAMEQSMTHYDDDEVVPPMPQDEHRFVYRLRVDVSTNPELWQAYTTEIGMPTCPELTAFTSDRANWRGREWAEAYRRCPALVDWVMARKDGYFWADLAAANPGLFAKTFLSQWSLSLGGEAYADVPAVVPGPVEKLVFPSRRYGLPLAVVGFAAALGLAWWAGAVRSHRRLVWFAAGLFATALVSAVATIVMVTGELQRFGVQEAVATRVAMVVLLGCALDAWLTRRRERAAAAAAISSTGAARPGPTQAAA
jgi:hypothetical protein